MKQPLFFPLIGVLLVLSWPASAELPLGRLFFTPEQRAKMDVARQQARHIRLDMEQPAENTPPPANIRLDGVITRSDGKTTVWLNHRIQEEDSQAAIGKDGAVRIMTSEPGRSVPLKVGQSLDMSSGEVEEIYRRPPPAPVPDPEKGKASATSSSATKSPETHLPPQESDPASEDQGENQSR